MNDRFTLVDIDIPFGRMVAIIIKWSLASIPAMIILGIVYMIIVGILGLFVTGFGSLY